MEVRRKGRGRGEGPGPPLQEGEQCVVPVTGSPSASPAAAAV